MPALGRGSKISRARQDSFCMGCTAVLAQEIRAVHGVVSGLPEGTGDHGGCAGHWPGW